MPTSDVLRLENVNVRYGDSAEVLREVNFTVPRGSFHFIVGASGAGKSTLLKLLFLSLRPSDGEMFLFGQPVHNAWRSRRVLLRRHIGMVFQDVRLIDHMSVYENIALPRAIAGERERDYRSDVRALINWTGLETRIDAYPPTLSDGERQRVAIARAVVARPILLLADEPTGNVDGKVGSLLLQLFAELNRLGTTVLITTHNPVEQDDIDAQLVRLERGRLILPGTEAP
ncbi:MAG: ATP-binding cassette domain-containing protein [Hyphomicrobiales bacterium]|nr:ATP-binding cassette domain-containing protein [Hyphomicrobiales bacterium]MCY4049306.1 ATP-binding cassette domain-containing protein [Hyphomicrobiales bacterium]MCY4053005.1 ATP-binding cassette domain-containing protein [Hyphomicrobiales bacterium]